MQSLQDCCFKVYLFFNLFGNCKKAHSRQHPSYQTRNEMIKRTERKKRRNRYSFICLCLQEATMPPVPCCHSILFSRTKRTFIPSSIHLAKKTMYLSSQLFTQTIPNMISILASGTWAGTTAIYIYQIFQFPCFLSVSISFFAK